MIKKSSIVLSSVAACAILASSFVFNGFAIGNTKAESIASLDTTKISQSTVPSKTLDSIVSKVAPASAEKSKDVSDSKKATVNNVSANTSKSTNCPTNSVDKVTDKNSVQTSYNQPTTATNNKIESANIMDKLQRIVYTKNCDNSTAKNTNNSNIQSALNSILNSRLSAAKPTTSKPSTSKPATSKPATPQKPASTPATNGDYTAFQKRVVELVNAERAKNGLKPLTMNSQVNKTATLKSQDMAKLGYFDHNSPTYGSPFDMMKKYGISYRTAGENIAMGQTTPEQVMKGWMNSPGHRANILKSSFTQIGVGVAKNSSGRLYWTQQFIG
ncbi:CAP domain-containing protein [Ruminiclostridium cellulolyticum]|uniref:SCP-like extracellular n=1 Tax=Ruminiclostridium cellulolyticum (strain ATCC 35319 / DSM 5812 / JCM 6584 / H10) TaxID=394503 RepID=B8I1I2_RUMCH|nr:CAP domain-containing protein [Ruminiclostridium cellulolyticum]ACL75780.1 SCP-like extracellular [Ruminiclostridium cellulolyticum H10]